MFDLALVKTELTPRMVFQLGTSDQLKVGNRIYAIGSPAGLEQTLTSGIVSAQKRRLLSLGDVLQIDAPINHGNSGGPIVDEAGRVQAVVFAGIESYEGSTSRFPSSSCGLSSRTLRGREDQSSMARFLRKDRDAARFAR